MPPASTHDSFVGFYQELLKRFLIQYKFFYFQSCLFYVKLILISHVSTNKFNYKYVTGKTPVFHTKWATRYSNSCPPPTAPLSTITLKSWKNSGKLEGRVNFPGVVHICPSFRNLGGGDFFALLVLGFCQVTRLMAKVTAILQ